MPEISDALELRAVLEQSDHGSRGQCQRGPGRLLGHGCRVRHDEATEIFHRIDGQSLFESVVRERLVPGHLDSLDLGGMSEEDKK